MVCGDAGDAEETISLLGDARPDIVLLDVTLKKPNGVELLKQLKQAHPALAILVLSIHDESLYAERMLHAGARGYLMKQEATEKVLEAIHQILRGDVYVGEGIRGRVLEEVADGDGPSLESPVARLSDRELQVFRLVGQGRSTRDIAQALHVSVKTVESHRRNILIKLGFADSHQLIQHAVLWAQRISPG